MNVRRAGKYESCMSGAHSPGWVVEMGLLQLYFCDSCMNEMIAAVGGDDSLDQVRARATHVKAELRRTKELVDKAIAVVEAI